VQVTGVGEGNFRVKKQLMKTKHSKGQLEKKLLGIETSFSLQEAINQNLGCNTWTTNDAEGVRNLYENARILAEAGVTFTTRASHRMKTAKYLPFRLPCSPGDTQVVRYSYESVAYEDGPWYLRGESIYFRITHRPFKGCEPMLSKVKPLWHRRVGITSNGTRGLTVDWNKRIRRTWLEDLEFS
jgi:hypothetical protein